MSRSVTMAAGCGHHSTGSTRRAVATNLVAVNHCIVAAVAAGFDQGASGSA